ncbi:serum paraoxonase arylesterase family protein [Seiridium cupressi]
MPQYASRSVAATGIATLVLIMASLFSPITLRVKVLGISRLFGGIKNTHGEDTHMIPDTLFSEDLHYHAPSGQLFGASESDEKTRNTWFPPLTNWKDPNAIGQGTIIAIDSKTLTATRLKLVNFKGPWNTHGIDIWSPPKDPTSVYIVGVNHLPNPEYYNTSPPPKDSKIPQARSRLELFHHKIGSSDLIHVRSIWHPLIRTPNDVLFRSLNEIYVTNDHLHRDGIMRMLEDFAYGSIGPTDLIHLKLADPLAPVADDTEGVVGTVANEGIHNNNGLGRGRTPTEIAIGRTAIGQLHLAEVDEQHPPTLKIYDTIQLPCTLDNPSFFSDPYAAKTGRDASGYVLAGLALAIAFPNGKDPIMVWLVQPAEGSGSTKTSKKDDKWTQKLIFQDDGNLLRTAATAVLVAIDPDTNGGKKQANLFVTGPFGKGVVASRINL